jgi:hypothetical protein
MNTHPAAIEMLEYNFDQINWYGLSENPAAIHLIIEELDKRVNWNKFCLNTAPEAIAIL